MVITAPVNPLRQKLCEIIHQRVGLVLPPEKDYLLQERLLPLARKRGFATIDEWISHIVSLPDEKEISETAEALATHETLFFRDTIPFREMENLYWPYYLAEREHSKRMRIWCAACSTGQEPYSIAMGWHKMQQSMDYRDYRLEVVATDLSEQAIAKARAGIYSQFDVQRGLPLPLLLSHFVQCGSEWKINPAIAQPIRFACHNLLRPLLTETEPFDVIFIRNVLIYFDEATKQRVLNLVMQKLAPDGVLVLGSAENPCYLVDELEKVQGSRHGFARKSAGLSARIITRQAMLMAGVRTRS